MELIVVLIVAVLGGMKLRSLRRQRRVDAVNGQASTPSSSGEPADDESSPLEQSAEAYRSRYSAAYGVASSLAVVAGVGAVAIMVGGVLAFAQGGDLFIGVGVACLVVAAGWYNYFASQAAVLRAQIDSTVSVVPGLDDEARQSIIFGS